MEIERRWLVEGWPALTPSSVLRMDQGYFAVRPAIRIRREAVLGGETRYVLCFKGGAGLAREEVEVDVDEGRYLRLKAMLSGPMIEKEQRRYSLPGGLTLDQRGAHTNRWQSSDFQCPQRRRRPAGPGLYSVFQRS